MTFPALFFIFLLIGYVFSSIHKISIPDKDGIVISSRNSHDLGSRAVVIEDLGVIVFLSGSNTQETGDHGANMQLYKLSDFSLLDTYEIEFNEDGLNDAIVKYDESSQKVYLLVNPWSTMGPFERSVVFFNVDSSSLTFIGKSQYSQDLGTGMEFDCLSQQVVWLGGKKIFSVMSGTNCHPGSPSDYSSALYMYDTDIQGYIGSSTSYTYRTSFLYLTKRMMLWKNSVGEDRVLLFDWDGGLHEFDTSLMKKSTDTIMSISSCEYIAIGYLETHDSDFTALDVEVIYIVYSYLTDGIYKIVVYNLKTRTLLQYFEVSDTTISSSSYSPNAPTMIFIDQEKWILHLFGIRAVMKFRIDPTTHLFKTTNQTVTPYRVDFLGLTTEDKGAKSGPAYFFPPKLYSSAGQDPLKEPKIYQTYSIIHPKYCGQASGPPTLGCDVVLHKIRFYSCSFGYYVDYVTMTGSSSSSENVDNILPSGIDLCQRTPEGYFASSHDDPNLSTCDLGGYPKKLSLTMECSSCELGFFSNAVIQNSSDCLPCPAGTYSSKTWITDVSSCSACPEDSFSELSAVNDVSKCQSCDDEEFFCGVGSTIKIKLTDASTSTKYPKLQISEERDAEWAMDGPFLLKIIFASSIIFGSIFLFFLCFSVLLCWDFSKDLLEICCLPISCILCPRSTSRKRFDFIPSKGRERKKSELIKCSRCIRNCFECFRSFRTLDFFFSMSHDVKEGEASVKNKSGCGGIFSFVSITIFTVLLTLSVFEFTSGFKEDITKTRLYFQGEEMKEEFGIFRFNYTMFGIFEGCEEYSNMSSNSGFRIQIEKKHCEPLEGEYRGCRCSWNCESCSLLDSELSVVFQFPTDGKYISFVKYGVSVPHYIEDETFDLESGIILQNTEKDETIKDIEIELALFKSMHIMISNWNLLVDFLPSSNRTGLSTSQLSSKKITSSISEANNTFSISMNMKLSNLQFIIEESLRKSLLGIIGQIFALFSLSVAIGGFLFGFADSFSTLDKICFCFSSFKKKFWICRFFNSKEKEKKGNFVVGIDQTCKKKKKNKNYYQETDDDDDIYDYNNQKKKDDFELIVVDVNENNNNDDDDETEEDLLKFLESERNKLSLKDSDDDVDENIKLCKSQIKNLLFVCQKMIKKTSRK